MSAGLLGRPIGGDGTLRHDEFWALKDVSFDLYPGECIGLIGHNGAGKTTLLKILNGLIKPDAGLVEVRGRMIALIALGAGFNPILSGRENIFVNAAVFGMDKSEVDAALADIIAFAELDEFIDGPVQSYSSGMIVRLGFSIAVHSRPDILILDEVLAVGDIGFQIKCYNTLSRLRREGVAFVLVSHNMHQISRFANRTLYLNRGAVMHYGENAAGIAAYLRDSSSVYERVGNESLPLDSTAGSGAVLLQNPRFLNDENRAVSSIEAGQSVVFTVDFLCKAACAEDAALDVLIKDSTGTVYQGVHVYAEPGHALPDQGRFEVRFDVMPSNVHVLHFSCALLGVGSVEIYDCLFDIPLQVLPNPDSHGSLVLPTTWALYAEQSAGTSLNTVDGTPS